MARLTNAGLRRAIPGGLLLLVCLLPLFPPRGLGETAAVAQEKTRAQRIMDRLRNPDGNDVLVSSHRSDWLHDPENSVVAIEGAIKIGVDIVEMDARPTRDGHLVLMHDKTVNRTTTGQGAVGSLTLDAIKKLRLKDAKGRVTACTVPTLEEALLAARGRVVVCLDKSSGYYKQARAVLKRTGTLGQVILTIPKGLTQYRNEVGPEVDDVVAMPVLYLDRADVLQQIPNPSDERKPAVISFDFKTSEYPTLQKIRELRKNGTRVWVNSMWVQQDAGHDDEKALKDPEANYGWLINLGFNVIQTDQPEFLIQYLKGKGLHE